VTGVQIKRAGTLCVREREKIDFLALVPLYSVRQPVLLSYGEILKREFM
jgi:hypothetical protein